MAAKFGTSHTKSSDVIYDVCCSICEDDGIFKEGRFHCQKCSKYLCDSCVLTHNKFLKDHAVTAKGEGDNWPVNTKVDETLELCVEHSSEKLTMFCEDHKKLLCQLCLLSNHRQCSQVVLLGEKIKSTETRMDEVKMAKRIEELQERLEDMVKIGEQSINSLQASYENVLVEIINLRRQINETLDRLQEMTIRKLEQLHSDLKVSLENDSKQCAEFISKLKGYDINRSENTSPERSFIIEIKCLDQTALADVFLRKQFKNADIEFQYNKELKTFLDSLTELGNITIHETLRCVNPNKVLIIKEKCQYKVRSATDTFTCFTTGICESVNGEFIIADRNNQCVKLLDPAFNLIEQLQLPLLPYSIFKISSNEMAVIIGNLTPVTQVHFIRVEKGTILKLNVIKLNHRCYGIACHQGDVFVTTPTAVCQYTIEGRLVKKLYEDKYEGFMGVGVSPDGQKIYVTANETGKLLTLTRDGAVTASFREPAFVHKYPISNIHVTSAGRVFVFGSCLSQVDTDGKKVLNTIILDMPSPGSVYINEDTSKMIVGLWNNDNVIEFKTKTKLT